MGRRVCLQGNLSCSFCGKGQQEVHKLVAGPTVYVCDECIGLCQEIFEEEPHAVEIRAMTVVAFLQQHLDGRPADSLTMAELVEAYRRNIWPPQQASTMSRPLDIAPLTGGEYTEVRDQSRRSKHPALDLSLSFVDPECVRLVSREVCERHNLVPVTRGNGNTFIVAMATPGTPEATNALDDVKFVTASPIAVVVAHPRQIKDVIAACFR